MWDSNHRILSSIQSVEAGRCPDHTVSTCAVAVRGKKPCLGVGIDINKASTYPLSVSIYSSNYKLAKLAKSTALSNKEFYISARIKGID